MHGRPHSRLLANARTLPPGWVTRVAAAEDMETLRSVAAELAATIGFVGVTYSLHHMGERPYRRTGRGVSLVHPLS